MTSRRHGNTAAAAAAAAAGRAIDCWCPAQFTQSHVDYANTICWVNR